MAIENVSSKEFFPEVAPPRSKAGRDKSSEIIMDNLGSKKMSVDKLRTDNFQNSLDKTMKSKTDETDSYAASSKPVKPKVGNKDPFFPKLPLPYHPPAGTTDARQPVAQSNANQTQDRVLLPISDDQSLVDTQGLVEDQGEDVGSISSPEPQWENNSQPIQDGNGFDNVIPYEVENGDYTKEAQSFLSKGIGDDQTGLMAKNYDGMVVSYPIKQIGKEALKPEEVTDLQSKGIWDMPTFYAVQPSQQFQVMEKFVESNKGSESALATAVPVSRPIAQFMASLENELGVSREELLGAFQKLPPGQLQKSPKETMIQVVKNLGLDSQESQMALGLYATMLAQMDMVRDQPREVKPEFFPSPMLKGTKLSESQVEGTRSLATERYSQNKALQLKTTPEMPPQQAISSKGFEVPKEAVNFDSSSMPDANLSRMETYSKFNSDTAQMSEFRNSNGSQDLLNQNGQNGNSNGNELAKGQQQNLIQSQQTLKPVENFDSKISEGKSSKLSGSEELLSGNANDMQVAGQPAHPGEKVLSAQSNKLEGATQVGIGQAQTDARIENIDIVMKNAQLMAQKGGGEMKMTLKPDHMGEIQLKVKLDGRNVDVQVLTERSEVKKLIEQNIGELKSGLATHNLQMDKMDVGVMDRQGNTNLNQHKQPDFNQAREFLDQFHQNQSHSRQESLWSGAQRENIVNRMAASKTMTPSSGSDVLRNSSRMGNSSGRLNVRA